MNIYKVTVRETSSFTAYILAEDQISAKETAIFSNVNEHDNQDFEQEVIRIEEIDTTPLGVNPD